ncbi:exported protein of unknown function [Clostridium beijerinckii]|nr:exported protein of unknown function [Clostridium beijerinckii]
MILSFPPTSFIILATTSSFFILINTSYGYYCCRLQGNNIIKENKIKVDQNTLISPVILVIPMDITLNI